MCVSVSVSVFTCLCVSVCVCVSAWMTIAIDAPSFDTHVSFRSGVRWKEDDVKELLDIAELTLRDSCKTLGLDVTVIRKERAVGAQAFVCLRVLCGCLFTTNAPIAGVIRTRPGRIRYEVLEEVVRCA